MANSKRNQGKKLDLSTLVGLGVAILGILGGLLLEGGVLGDVTQHTAALIVLGGTFGAVMVNTPGPYLAGALRRMKDIFFIADEHAEEKLEELVILANKARKTGLVSLEEDALKAEDPFLGKALGLAVDGCDLSELRAMMELEIAVEEHRAEAEAKVYESAGGYAPTIGIIGAVLGLIQVMKHLDDIKEVGHGIAVAFVATVYGVAAANIFFLPAANKIKARIARETQMRELTLEGVIGIVQGLNPKLIRNKLSAYLPHPGKAKKAFVGPKAVAA